MGIVILGCPVVQVEHGESVRLQVRADRQYPWSLVCAPRPDHTHGGSTTKSAWTLEQISQGPTGRPDVPLTLRSVRYEKHAVRSDHGVDNAIGGSFSSRIRASEGSLRKIGCGAESGGAPVVRYQRSEPAGGRWSSGCRTNESPGPVARAAREPNVTSAGPVF